MGKSFASLKRQVTETRRRSKRRDGGEVGRSKREALYAHMRAGGKPEVKEKKSSTASAWVVKDMNEDEPVIINKPAEDKGVVSGVHQNNTRVEPAILAEHSRVVHEFISVNPDDKQSRFLQFMHELRDSEKDQRQKQKVIVFVKESKTAKALCTSLGQHRRLYKAMKKGFVKKKFSDTKGVAVLLKYLKEDEQEQVVSFFRSGRVHTVIVMDDCSSDLWPQKQTISHVINYDMPPHAGLYESRSGLADAPNGRVVSFLTPIRANRELAPALVEHLDQQQVPIPQSLMSLKELQDKLGTRKAAS